MIERIPPADILKDSRYQLTEFIDGEGNQLTYEQLDEFLKALKKLPQEQSDAKSVQI